MLNHEHKTCDHVLKYCEKCDVAYCTKCGEEWKKQSPIDLYRQYPPTPQWPHRDDQQPYRVTCTHGAP
jgi:hypothetical protein